MALLLRDDDADLFLPRTTLERLKEIIINRMKTIPRLGEKECKVIRANVPFLRDLAHWVSGLNS